MVRGPAEQHQRMVINRRRERYGSGDGREAGRFEMICNANLRQATASVHLVTVRRQMSARILIASFRRRLRMFAPGFGNSHSRSERTSEASASTAALMIVLAVLLYWFLYL